MKRILALVVALAFFAMIFCGCPAPVRAAVSFTALDPADFIVGMDLDGDNKHITYRFDDIAPLTRMTFYGSDDYSTGELTRSGNFTFRYTLESVHFTRIWFRANYTGTDVYENGPITDGVIDVHDIMPGAELELTCFFNLALHDTDTDVSDLEGTLHHGTFITNAYYYDADGNYLGNAEGVQFQESWLVSTDEMLTSSFKTVLTVPAGAYYIAPCLTGTVSLPETSSTTARLGFYFSGFQMSVDINMIYEQSATMQAVKDKLDEIGDQIDDQNNKLDQIINGDSGVDSSDTDFGFASDTLHDAMDGVNGVINDNTDKISNMFSSSVMRSTTSSLSSGISSLFNGNEIDICGLQVNPLMLFVIISSVTVIVSLVINYIFRKRGGS